MSCSSSSYSSVSPEPAAPTGKARRSSPVAHYEAKIGETIKGGGSAYTVLRKLGWGAYCSVWLVKDEATGRYRALKIYQSHPQYERAALQELALAQAIEQLARHDGVAHLPHSYSEFTLNIEDGSRSRRHQCLVTAVQGESLASVDRRAGYYGLALDTVRLIARQLIEALDVLHNTLERIHTDLKPDNVLLRLQRPGADEADMTQVVEANLARIPLLPPHHRHGRRPSQPVISPLLPGLSAAAHAVVDGVISSRSDSSLTVTTTADALSPASPASSVTSSTTSSAPPSPPTMTEDLPEAEATSMETEARQREVDRLTGVGCPVAGLKGLSFDDGFQGVVLVDLGSTRPNQKRHVNSNVCSLAYRAPEIVLHNKRWDASIDVWALGCLLFEVATGDPLFRPHHSRDERVVATDHLAQMLCIAEVRRLPGPVAMVGSRLAQAVIRPDGGLRDIRVQVTRTPIEEMLKRDYSFSEVDAADVARFLKRMLALDPQRRATVRELRDDPFLRLGV